MKVALTTAHAVRSNQTLFTSWYTGSSKDKGVHFAELDENGKVLINKNLSADGQFTQINALANGQPVVAYNETYTQDGKGFNRVKLATLANDKIKSIELSAAGANATHPVLEPIGKNETVVVWKDHNKIYYQKVNAHKM